MRHQSRFIRLHTLVVLTCALSTTFLPIKAQASSSDCVSCGVDRSTRGSVQGSEQASAQMSAGAGVIVLGGASMLAGSGKLVVESIKAVGSGVVVTLKTLANAGSVTLQLSGKTLRSRAG